jgi:hypothetical protein
MSKKERPVPNKVQPPPGPSKNPTSATQDCPPRASDTPSPKDVINLINEAEDWAAKLSAAANWEGLAAIFNSTDYSDSANKRRRRDVARRVLIEAGSQAQEAVLQQMNLDQVGQHELAEVLTVIGDQRSVGSLVRVFPRIKPFVGCQSRIVSFLAKFPSIETATAMERYLTDNYVGTRIEAACCLGVLGYGETIPALEMALNEYSSSARDGLRRAGTDFAKSLISKWEEKRRASAPPVSQMPDSEMFTVLRNLCDAYTESDWRTIESLEIIATDIGEELNRRGGKTEMLRLFKMLQGRRGARTLEMHWNGIGHWRG